MTAATAGREKPATLCGELYQLTRRLVEVEEQVELLAERVEADVDLLRGRMLAVKDRHRSLLDYVTERLSPEVEKVPRLEVDRCGSSRRSTQKSVEV